MKAMIFAAGKGTRLQHETNDKPKALVEINGKTLLQICIEKLKSFGISEIVINVHHFADKIEKYLKNHNNFGLSIHISDERDALLDTGGGLVKAKHFFRVNEDILIHNVDIFSEINLHEMMNFHKKNKALATLAVKDRKTNRKLLFNKANELVGWKNFATGEEIFSRKQHEFFDFAFSGIHIINTKIFDFITQKGKFSIIKAYLELSKQYKITGFTHNNTFWIDAGKPETLKSLRQRMSSF